MDGVFGVADEFFNLSPEVKTKSSKKVGTSSNGWDDLERERSVLYRLTWEKDGGGGEGEVERKLVPHPITWKGKGLAFIC